MIKLKWIAQSGSMQLLILALRRWSQEVGGFDSSLGYIVRPWDASCPTGTEFGQWNALTLCLVSYCGVYHSLNNSYFAHKHALCFSCTRYRVNDFSNKLVYFGETWYLEPSVWKIDALIFTSVKLRAIRMSLLAVYVQMVWDVSELQESIQEISILTCVHRCFQNSLQFSRFYICASFLQKWIFSFQKS